jgi:CBS-domain-containing membrane protein
MDMSHEEVPTLKMHTLRMLLKRTTVPMVVVEESAAVDDIRRLVSERGAPLVVVVDSARALVGTVSTEQLGPLTSSAQPARVVAVVAEEDVAATAERVAADDITYVLVIEGTGELIGILSGSAIVAHRYRRAA